MSGPRNSEAIRRLTESDFDPLFSQQSRAYPTFFQGGSDQMERIRDSVRKSLNRPGVAWYGLFDGDRLKGSMRLHDFAVNYRGCEVNAGGVGGVAVDLVDKRQHVAKHLMEFYVRHSREAGATLGLLWPFRPDFYKKMGFGYGGRTFRYSVTPASFPKAPAGLRTRMLGVEDQAAVADCYHRYARSRTGMVLERDGTCPKFIADALSLERVVGYDRDGKLDGFLIYRFGEKDEHNVLSYDLFVTRLVYTSPESLAALVGFLSDQKDQVRRVVVDIPDGHLHFLLNDPREADRELLNIVTHAVGKTGIGIMYRLFDVPKFFGATGDAKYGDGSLAVRFEIPDSFVPNNGGSYTVAFDEGKASLSAGGRTTVVVSLDIADFSSLLMGAVSLGKLAMYGLANVSDPSQIPTLDRVLAMSLEPECMHPF